MQANNIRIDPPYWFSGMKNGALQLLLSAPGIGRANVSVSHPGAALTGIARPYSPNYLFVCLDVSRAEPGLIPLHISLGGTGRTVMYELRRRAEGSAQRQGFTPADVLYLVMPDRFAQGRHGCAHASGLKPYKTDRSEPSLRHGGDLEGLRRHLDYIADLGVTAIWLTPIFENNNPDIGLTSSYHGYAVTDFYRVDPRLGSMDDYRRLVGEAHRHGLKVVMDLVFNHCGACHPWAADPPERDWFNHPVATMPPEATAASPAYVQTNYRLTPTVDPYAADVDLDETTRGWFAPQMPDLNQHNPRLMAYLTQQSKWWIEASGADGIRMDTYPYAFADAMAAWAREINEEYPRLGVVGETWVAEPAFTAAWQRGSAIARTETHLKSVMDFALFERLNMAKGEETDGWAAGLNRIYNTLAYDYLYPEPQNVLAFIDNHDTDRFLGTGRDAATLRQALALLLFIRRTPQIYYGTEILMNGTKARTDGDVRRDFPGGFPGDGPGAFTPEGRTRQENQMHSWLRRLLRWRRASPLIAEGTMKQFIPQGGVYVVHRALGNRRALLVLNGTSHPATYRAARYAEVVPPGTMAREVTTGRTYRPDRDIKLSPRQTLVLEIIKY